MTSYVISTDFQGLVGITDFEQAEDFGRELISSYEYMAPSLVE
jgi:hypothetical protein